MTSMGSDQLEVKSAQTEQQGSAEEAFPLALLAAFAKQTSRKELTLDLKGPEEKPKKSHGKEESTVELHEFKEKEGKPKKGQGKEEFTPEFPGLKEPEEKSKKGQGKEDHRRPPPNQPMPDVYYIIPQDWPCSDRLILGGKSYSPVK